LRSTSRCRRKRRRSFRAFSTCIPTYASFTDSVRANQILPGVLKMTSREQPGCGILFAFAQAHVTLMPNFCSIVTWRSWKESPRRTRNNTRASQTIQEYRGRGPGSTFQRCWCWYLRGGGGAGKRGGENVRRCPSQIEEE
jgi:hypothetical protein